MAKLSIGNIHADMGIAQVKTGELYTVQMVDLASKKVIICNEAGEEKVVSKATLERWYRELNDDEVQKFNQSDAAEETTESKDADESSAVPEDEAVADEGSSQTTSEEQVAGGEDASGETGAGTEVGDRGDAESGDSGARDGEQADGSTPESGDAEGDGSDEEVKSPVTPSNAGKDKDKAKEKKATGKYNPVLEKVRQTIIDTVMADSDSIQLKSTTTYDVLKEKHNFAEITRGHNRFNVSVMSKCLTEDQINKVKINPASFGWSIDADFTVFDEGDIEMAVQLIRQSREYRLANPVTRRSKKDKK